MVPRREDLPGRLGTLSRGRGGARPSHAVPRWLTVVLIAELVLAMVLRLQAPLDLIRGEELTSHRFLQLVGLALGPALVAVCYRVWRLAGLSQSQATLAQQQVDDVLAIASEWIWTIDREGNLLESNDALRNILGYPAGDVVGTSSFRLMHPDSHDTLTAALTAAASAETGWSRRVSAWRHRDGSRRYLESSATPLRDASGALVGFRGASRDVSFEAEATAARATAQAERARVEGRIEQVLFDDALLSAVYQPIVRIDSGQITGVEALSRFHGEPRRGPDVWFAEAAEVGLDRDLEMLAICRAAAAITALSDDHYLTLNASAATLCTEELLRFVHEAGVPAERIVFELTEHAVVGDYDELINQLAKLRRLGVRLAIDDAGAGYASLRHILRLRPDFIKLDRALISNIDTDPVRRALTAAMVSFASEVGATLIAEGVEQHNELEALYSVGVRYAQGYLLGRPSPLDDWRANGKIRPTINGGSLLRQTI